MIELTTRPESMSASSVMTTDMPNETLPASCMYTGLEVADMIEAESGSETVLHSEESTTGYESSDPVTVVYVYVHVVVAFM